MRRAHVTTSFAAISTVWFPRSRAVKADDVLKLPRKVKDGPARKLEVDILSHQ